MSCFFCHSYFHLSQNCKIYSSDESRKEFAGQNNLCHFCFTFTDAQHNYQSEECKAKRKCYICFTAAHHTFLCWHRFKAPVTFIPRIQTAVFCRFLQMFGDNPFEQYTLAFMSPIAYKLITLKPLKIIHRIKIGNDFDATTFNNSNVLINGAITLSRVKFDENYLKNVICKAPFVTIQNSMICYKDFLQILSSETTFLTCYRLTLTTKSVNFVELLQKIPNILNLELHKTNIKLGNSWAKDLLKFQSKTRLESLKITINDINFNQKDLESVLKITNMEINLKIDAPLTLGYENTCAMLLKKLEKGFVPCDKNMSRLNISVLKIPENNYKFSKHFKLR